MSTSFLSVDTTSKNLMLTYFNGAVIKTIQCKAIKDGKNVILARIKEFEIDFTELSFITFINGPGSFTGLRIGQMVVQSLCFSYNLPCLCISKLQFIAQQQYLTNNKTKISVALNALNDEYYFGSFIKDRYNIMQYDDEHFLCKKDELPSENVIFDEEIDEFAKYEKTIIALSLQRNFKDLFITYILSI